MKWLENLEHSLSNLVLVGKFVLEFLSVLCVLIGLIAVLKTIMQIKRHRNIDFPFIEIRLKFGLWLSFALELQLGADILETTSSPNLQSLTRLGVIAVIRTFLNYFLNQELEEELKFQEKNSSKKSTISMRNPEK